MEHVGSQASAAPSTTRRLLAGDVARTFGVGVQTLHYYERRGLIPAPPRSEAGYRLYPPEFVERVAFIRKAQALGLPLAEIGDVLRLAEQGTSPCPRVAAALAEKLTEVDRRLQELRSFRDDLAALVARGAERAAAGGPGQICAIVEGARTSTTGDAVVAVGLARRTKHRVR